MYEEFFKSHLKCYQNYIGVTFQKVLKQAGNSAKNETVCHDFEKKG